MQICLPEDDTKDLAAWKLADKVSKLVFRHWVDAVDMSLEAIHGLNSPKVILDLVRREETEIAKESLEVIIRKARDINLALQRGSVDSSEWYFEEKAKDVFR